MFEEYYELFEECRKYNNPNYHQLKEIQKQWDELTLKFFKYFDFKNITDMWTLLNDELCDSDNYFNNFVADLEYYSDRMNLNRWCRLQLLLGNAVDKAYE